MIGKISIFLYRLFFIVSFAAIGLVIWEEIANIVGLTLLRGSMSDWQLITISAISLLFVIAFQLREIKAVLNTKSIE